MGYTILHFTNHSVKLTFSPNILNNLQSYFFILNENMIFQTNYIVVSLINWLSYTCWLVYFYFLSTLLQFFSFPPHVNHHFIIHLIYTEYYLTVYFLALSFVLYFTFIALILCFITHAHYHNIYLNVKNFYQFPDLRIIRKLFIFHLIYLIMIYIYMMGFNPRRHFTYASLDKCL